MSIGQSREDSAETLRVEGEKQRELERQAREDARETQQVEEEKRRRQKKGNKDG